LVLRITFSIIYLFLNNLRTLLGSLNGTVHFNTVRMLLAEGKLVPRDGRRG